MLKFMFSLLIVFTITAERKDLIFKSPSGKFFSRSALCVLCQQAIDIE